MTDHDRERSIHRAHAIIRAFVRQATSAAGEDPASLVRLLRHTLPAHFAYEERAGGFFARLEERGTSVLLLDRLRAEHREFSARLDRLERAVAAGEDARDELAAIAERLREHEWIESISAVQVGLHAPGDAASEPELAVRALPDAARPAVGALVERVHALAAGNRDELLASITVAAPESLPQEALRAAVEDAMSARGLDFVEVRLRPGEGEPTLQETRFHRLR